MLQINIQGEKTKNKKENKILWVLFHRNVTMATSEGSCRQDGGRKKKHRIDLFPTTKEERLTFFSVFFHSLCDQLLKVAEGHCNSPLLISSSSLWTSTKRRQSDCFFFQAATGPANENIPLTYAPPPHRKKNRMNSNSCGFTHHLSDVKSFLPHSLCEKLHERCRACA